MEHQSNPNGNKKPENQEPDLMGYEGQVTAPEETKLPATSNADDVQTLINQAVKEVTVDPKTGKYVYPKDMDPMLKAAVAATKSYRDNQSGFTKSQQSNKELEAERDELRQRLANVTAGRLEITQEEKVELEELKKTDPDAWRTRLNDIESKSKESIQAELETATEEARKKASGEFELERRYEYLAEFNKGREVEITPEVLDNDIPPRITAKLAKGEVTFEDYLDEVSEYLETGKVVSDTTVTTTTDLNTVGGSSTVPSPSKDELEIDYSMTTL
jgi:hypothetical protein